MAVFGLLAGSLPGVRAADPAWWTGVFHPGETTTTTNYEPANLGQLKNFAVHAQAHLNDRLNGFGGAGGAINTMVAAWPSIGADNYAPLNLGQLKNVADKFYARLDAVGFDYKSQLSAAGYPASRWTTIDGTSYQRPWNKSTTPSTNYAPANLGQLKVLFSFDLTGFSVVDSDGDGLTDAWESAHGLLSNAPDQNHNGILDGEDDFDGDGVSNAQEIVDGTDPFDPNSVLNSPAASVDSTNANGLVVYSPI